MQKLTPELKRSGALALLLLVYLATLARLQRGGAPIGSG